MSAVIVLMDRPIVMHMRESMIMFMRVIVVVRVLVLEIMSLARGRRASAHGHRRAGRVMDRACVCGR